MIASYQYFKKKRAERAVRLNFPSARPDAATESGGREKVEASQQADSSAAGINIEAAAGVTRPERAEEQAAKRHRRTYRWKLIAGLILPYFLAQVDLTIVASALC